MPFMERTLGMRNGGNMYFMGDQVSTLYRRKQCRGFRSVTVIVTDMDAVFPEFKNIEKAICIFHSSNKLGKDINPTSLPLAVVK